jgi:fatty-acyl-CoA synthase
MAEPRRTAQSPCAPTQEDWQQLPPEQRAKLLARQGPAYPSADLVGVVDEEMHDIPQDARAMGEVVMRGNNVMSGYFADEAATEKAFRGGWFHSGDLAAWHPDGNIELRDRSKDIIISGGENISSTRSSKRSPPIRPCSSAP